MKIVICDDDAQDLRMILREVEGSAASLGIDAGISCYKDGVSLCEKLEAIQYDVLFLDIDMPGIDGIDIACRLQQMHGYGRIVFVTNRSDLVFDAIRFCPFRFIRKERLTAEMPETMRALQRKLEEEQLLLDVGQTGVLQRKLYLREIIYLESRSHNLEIHTLTDVVVLRGKISEYEKRLSSRGFVRIHRGFVVNMRYVKAIRGKGVTLEDGRELAVGRSYAETVKTSYAEYLRRNVGGV